VSKEDIIKVFCDFHDRGKLDKSINATFIALIPKIYGVVDPKDFYSISLLVAFKKLLKDFSKWDKYGVGEDYP
jgi:hypothetical protein